MSSFIEHLRLTEDERKVYEILLGMGQLTDIEIKEYAHIHISKVQQALNSLVEKGAVGVTEGYINKYFARIPLGYLAEISNKMKQEIEIKLKDAEGELSTFQKQLEEKGTTLQQQLTDNLAAKSQQFEENIKEVVDSEKTKTEEQKSLFSTKVKEAEAIANNVSSEAKSKLFATFKENVVQYNEKINEVKEAVNSEIKQIEKEVGDDITGSNQRVNELAEHATNNLSAINTGIKPKMNEILTTVLSEIDNIQLLIKNNIDMSKLDASAFHKEQVDKYLTLTSELTKKATETIDGVNNSVSDILDELNNKLESIFTAKTAELSQKVQETLNNLNEQIEQIKQQMLGEVLNQQSSTIKATIAKIKDQSAIHFTEFQNMEQRQRNEIASERDMFLQKLNARYTDILTSFEDTLKNMREQVNSRLSNVLDVAETKLTSNITDVQNVITQFRDTVTANLKNLSEQISSTLTERTGNIEQVMEQTKQHFEQLITTTETELEDKYKQALEKVDASLGGLLEELNGYFEDLMANLNASIEKMLAGTKEFIEEGKLLSEQSIISKIQEFSAIVDKTSTNIKETAANLMEITEKLGTDFQTIEARAKGISVPKVETAVVIGEDAVKEYIARIIERVRRGATLIVPDTSYVPVDVIKGLKPGRNIKIAFNTTNISESWIKDITTSQATIELLVPRGTMLEEAVYIGVASGEEEILIGTIDEASKEIVAIISSSSYFSKMLTKLIISDAMRGKEKLRY